MVLFGFVIIGSTLVDLIVINITFTISFGITLFNIPK